MIATVRERAIILRDWEVRAVLEGRKTQLRRPISLTQFQPSDTPGYDWTFRCRRGLWQDYRNADFLAKFCPHGRTGDRLWGRETWALVWPSFDGEAGIVDEVSEFKGPVPSERPEFGWVPWYAADSDDISHHPDDRWVKRWRPSTHMPRWASRITLEITGVRVERLQDIGTEDAFREGIDIEPLLARCSKAWQCTNEHSWPGLGAYDDPLSQAAGGRPWGECWCVRGEFESLWNSINGKSHPWASNPWVWAITFMRVEG